MVHINHPTGNYKMSFWQAYEACQTKGWALTTPEELKSLHKDGFTVFFLTINCILAFFLAKNNNNLSN